MGEAIAGALVTALLGGLGWIVIRLVDRRSPKAKIEEAGQLLAILRDLAVSGASIEDLQELKSRIVTSRGVQKRIQSDLLREARLEDLPRFEDTQTGMNMISANLATLAEAKVEHLSAQLVAILEADRMRLLTEAQEKWRQFSDAQARFAASYVEGGSMYPLVFASEKEHLAVQRAATLQLELDQERSLQE